MTVTAAVIRVDTAVIVGMMADMTVGINDQNATKRRDARNDPSVPTPSPKAGDLNFHSSSYDWLVIAGARAQFMGVGTINGAGSYGFMLTAIDGALPGGGESDKF